MYRTAFRNVRAHKGRLLMTMLAVLLGTAFVAGTLVFSDSIEQPLKTACPAATPTISVQVTRHRRGPELRSSNTSDARSRSPRPRSGRIAALPAPRSRAGTVTGFAGLSDPHGNLIGSLGNTQGTNWVAVGDTARTPELPDGAGHRPDLGRQIAIDRRTASDNSFKIGDTVRVAVNGPVLQMTVTGIFTTDDPHVSSRRLARPLRHRHRAAPLPPTGPVRQHPGRRQRPAPARTNCAARSSRSSRDSANITVKTGTQLDADQPHSPAATRPGCRNVLLAFAGIALFVGVFLIANTFTMLIAQRTRELALLRAIGASRRQITNAVLLEGLLVGVGASVAGLVAGIGIGAALQGLMGSMGSQSPPARPGRLAHHRPGHPADRRSRSPSWRRCCPACVPPGSPRSPRCAATTPRPPRRASPFATASAAPSPGSAWHSSSAGPSTAAPSERSRRRRGAVSTLVGVFVLTPRCPGRRSPWSARCYTRLFGIPGTWPGRTPCATRAEPPQPPRHSPSESP